MKQQENKRLSLYWVDKLREFSEKVDNKEMTTEKAFYLFEYWAIKEENKFNERWYK